MTTITQDMRFRLSLIRYSEKHGVSKAAIRYHVNRQYIYRWKNRYDGSWDSLRNLSRRPHSHPNQHTPAELKLIADMRRRNPQCRSGCLLGEAHSARLSAFHHRSVPCSETPGDHGGQASKPQVHSQAL